MYNPKHFAQTDPVPMRQLIRDFPLATLVSRDDTGLVANHIPFEVDDDVAILRGHVARANPVWQTTDADGEVLAIFRGADAYISPSWYATKQDGGRVVPTWNYCAVHLYGTVRFLEDATWLRGQIDRLTAQQEHGRREPWRVTDAPAEYIEAMLRAIVGVEIEVKRRSAKWKLSQNRSEPDREGVIRGLREAGANAAAEAIRRG